MYRLLLIAGVILLLGMGGFLYWKLQPEDYAGYVMEKQLHGDSGQQVIVWNAMPVAAAYQALARSRTLFRAELSPASRLEADYLGSLFGLTDAAVSQRVALQAKLSAGAATAADLANYDPIVAGIRSLDTPVELIPVEANIFEAITAQRRYLELWQSSGRAGVFDPADPLVQSAHERLTTAYDLLLDLYPDEQFQNKRAFFDHLAALDFL